MDWFGFFLFFTVMFFSSVMGAMLVLLYQLILDRREYRKQIKRLCLEGKVKI